MIWKSSFPSDSAPNIHLCRIPIVYFIIGLLWIVLSDYILLLFDLSHWNYENIQMIKGCLFIAVTTLLLYFLMRRHFQQIIHYNKNLKESESRFRNAIMEAPFPVIIHSESGEVLFLNNVWTELTGYRHEEMPTILEWTKKAFRDKQDYANSMIRKTYELKQPLNHGEITLVTKDGEHRTWNLSSSPLGKTPEEKQLCISIAIDITQQKRLEKQLIQAQKMESIGRLAGGVAHDFNNILMVIHGYTDFAFSKISVDKQIRSDLFEIKKAADRATSLTRQLLAFSRKQVLQPEILDLNQLIMNMDKMLRRLIGEDIEYVTIPSEHLWKIKADPGQIEQVITNLVVNARDAMPTGGQITIETKNVFLDHEYVQTHIEVISGNHVMLAVSDSGSGMEKETLERIFDPFFTTKDKGKGTGLGLSTVHGIVKQSGGNIFVYSEVGKGTTFKIYFPQETSKSEPALFSEKKNDSLRGTETILVVEDEEVVRKLVERTLANEGYQVLIAGYGTEAITLSESFQNPIHLLITDVIMPKMSGRELADTLAKVRENMKILFISGYTDNAVVHHGMLDNGIEFLQKPFSPNQLLKKVRDILDQK